jgi:hypothetical protein
MRRRALRILLVAIFGVGAVGAAFAGRGRIPGDINADGVVDHEDLAILITLWGHQGSAADLNGDGWVDFDDLLILLGHWT